MDYDEPLGLSWTSEMRAVEQQLRWWREAEWPFGPIWTAASWVLDGLHTGMDRTIRDVADRMLRNGDYIPEMYEELCRRVQVAVTILKSPNPVELLQTVDD